MTIRIAVLGLTAAALAACSQSLDFKLPANNPLELAIYQRGSLVKTCTIAPSSSQFDQLQALLTSNQEDWESSLVTFAPSVLVTGRDFSINFLQDTIVLNHDHRQVTHQIPANSYAFLGCPDGT